MSLAETAPSPAGSALVEIDWLVCPVMSAVLRHPPPRHSAARRLLFACCGSPGRFQQLFQLFECLGILSADWRVIAARIRSLQSTNHGACNRNRGTIVAGFADKIPLRGSWNVAAETVPAKSIDDIDGSSFANSRSILRYVEFKKLPIMRRSVEAPVPLDHGFPRDQLNDGSRWIHGAPRRIGGGERSVETALQVVDVELAHRRHLRDAAK